MAGGGVYSLATRGAEDVINKSIPLVIDALNSMLIPEDSHILLSPIWEQRMEDISKAGRKINSLNQGKNPQLGINIVYADQPKNDFNSLVQTVLGLGHFPSYLETVENVYPFFSANSFYKQILPDNSLDFCFSATAMHWLNKKPCDINHHVHMVGAEGEDISCFQNRVKKTGKQFCLTAPVSLKVGENWSFLIFAEMTMESTLAILGVNMFGNFAQNWKEFFDQGRIT